MTEPWSPETGLQKMLPDIIPPFLRIGKKLINIFHLNTVIMIIDKEVSEFKACGFTEVYLTNFDAPFVAEAHVKVAMKLKKNRYSHQ